MRKKLKWRRMVKLLMILHSDSSPFTHHCEVEPALISLQVLVLLGLVQSVSGCKYMGLQEALAHLHGLTIGQQTALPKKKKNALLYFRVITYVLINPSISFLKSKLHQLLGTHT